MYQKAKKTLQMILIHPKTTGAEVLISPPMSTLGIAAFVESCHGFIS